MTKTGGLPKILDTGHALHGVTFVGHPARAVPATHRGVAVLAGTRARRTNRAANPRLAALSHRRAIDDWARLDPIEQVPDNVGIHTGSRTREDASYHMREILQ